MTNRDFNLLTKYYIEHIKTYVDTNDINICMAFVIASLMYNLDRLQNMLINEKKRRKKQ